MKEMLSANMKKVEISWDEIQGRDIALDVTHGRTRATFNGKINSFHGFNYNGSGSLLAAAVGFNVNEAIAELSRLWPGIEFKSS